MTIVSAQFWLTSAAWLVAITCLASGSVHGQLIELGSNRQLLFDNLLIDRSEGIQLRMIPPAQEFEPVLSPDKPWEANGIGAYNTVLYENGKFRMWYSATTAREANYMGTELVLCYAESLDGVHWEKPELGLVEYNGSTANNIITPTRRGASQQGASVMRDDRAPADERYKLWTKYHPPEQKVETEADETVGLHAMTSPDGLRWTLLGGPHYPLKRGNAADSQSVVFWDEDLGKYVGLVRIKRYGTAYGDSTSRKRHVSVGLTLSDNFLDWSYTREVFRVEERIPVPAQELGLPPFADLYTPVGMKVPGVANAYVLLPTPYYRWGKDDFPANIDVGLATSRNLVDWWQPSDPEPFLRLGPDGTATSGMIFSNPWLIPIDDELWFYYSGWGVDHRGSTPFDPSKTGVFRVRMRRDGFVAAVAGNQGGEFTTPIVTFDGDQLVLNLDGSAGGWLQVEIQSPGGAPLDGFRLDQCKTVRGNAVSKAVSWQGDPDLSSLAGVPVRLRFVMRSMRLFAFQFIEGSP
jgi:hypothetical protein